MGYSTPRQQQNVTFIDNLPDLEEFELPSNLNGLSKEQFGKVSNKIREPFKASPHSGMNQDFPQASTNIRQNFEDLPQANKKSVSKIHSRQQLDVNTRQDNINTSINHNIEHSQQMYNPNQQQDKINVVEEHFNHFNMPVGSPSCLDVAEHVSKCPICSKFYNTDKTIYIIAIITLAIICILLLKKVLDV